MVREFKYHEQKLLKKVDFLQWKSDQSLHESRVMRRYHVTKREDYIKYNKMCGQITKLANKLSLLDPRDPFRAKMSDALLEKLYKRRLAVIMVRLKMAETVKQAVVYVEQGHVRVGPETITDSAYLVTRNMEDFVTWVDTSKIKRKILKYNDKLDDFDLL